MNILIFCVDKTKVYKNVNGKPCNVFEHIQNIRDWNAKPQSFASTGTVENAQALLKTNAKKKLMVVDGNDNLRIVSSNFKQPIAQFAQPFIGGVL